MAVFGTVFAPSTAVPWLSLKSFDVPALAINASVDVVVPFRVPAPAADYAFDFTVMGAAGLTVTVKNKTVNSVTVTLATTAMITINTARVVVICGRSAHQ